MEALLCAEPSSRCRRYSSEQDKNSYQLELSDRISQISKENIQHTRGEKCYGEQ
uniref:Unnamed protein product n=1 Tax=Macaca fascicularis TaxID=9541 RepID=Q9N053_MACFA|nr:unnamed protein product [Macaca fascicularis]